MQLVSCGAVIAEPGYALETFGTKIPESFCRRWRSGTKTQVIGQAELFPVLLAKMTWAERIRGRRVIFFIDNDSARFSLIRAYSPALASAEVLWKSAEQDSLLALFPWYCRVPSASNISDKPSKLEFKEIISLGGRVVSAVIPAEWPRTLM